MTTPSGQFGDTTYTKVFVGGLAWETQKETMKKYFEKFGDILEAVIITDKAVGKSKGYGFVTFCEAEAAMRACVDAAPVIDGRRATCNLASMGVQRSKPSTPKHGGSRNFRVMSGFQRATFPSAATFPHYAIQQGIPYNLYGVTIVYMEEQLINIQHMGLRLALVCYRVQLLRFTHTQLTKATVFSIHTTISSLIQLLLARVTQHNTTMVPLFPSLPRLHCIQFVLLCHRHDNDDATCTNSSSFREIVGIIVK